MDRQTTFVQALGRSTDFLQAQQNTMTALGWALQGSLGTNTVVDGFTLVPTSPASLTATLTPGAIYQVGSTEATTWSSLPANTAPIVKQGLMTLADPITFAPPSTSGYAQCFLIEAQYADLDTTPVLLPYYNSSNPTQPFQGPNNSGVSQPTQRLGIAAIQVKAGLAAAAGSQVVPTPDAGWVGLFVVTLANGATSISAGNIATYAAAPFVPVKLPGVPAGVQKGAWVFAAASGTDTYAATLFSTAAYPYARTVGMEILVYFANANATTTPTLTENGQPAAQIRKQGGGAPSASDVSGYVPLIWDGTYWRINGLAASDVLFTVQTQFLISTAITKVVGPNTGADFADLNAAFTWLSKYLITPQGSVTFQCQAGKVTYTNALTLNHPNMDRVTVQGATLLASPPTSAAFPVTGNRTTDAATALTNLRAIYATELFFSGAGGTGIASNTKINIANLLITGDGTGSVNGAGLYLSAGAVLSNVSVHGFLGTGIGLLGGTLNIGGVVSATANGQAGTGAQNGTGIQQAANLITCYNGTAGLQVLAGGNCSAPSGVGTLQSFENAGHGVFANVQSSVLLAAGSLIQNNGGNGIYALDDCAVVAQGCTSRNNTGYGIYCDASEVNFNSSSLSGNSSGAFATNAGLIKGVGATGLAGSCSPAVNTYGANNNSFITN